MPEFPPLQNDLLLRALRGEDLNRPPVWMMRQAGRYLPAFRALREKHSFFERCETPALATEITLQPVDQLGVDAAILFSDILVIPKAMGLNVRIEPGEGPRIDPPVRSAAEAANLPATELDVEDRLHHVMDALRLTRRELGGRVPLIGFAGAPWTLLCYMVEGRGSKNFEIAKSFCFQEPAAAEELLQKLTDISIRYLNAQIAAGAQAVQVFDSWAGLLSPADFQRFSLPFLQQIAREVKGAPLILFARGAWHSLEALSQTGAAALGLGWQTSPEFARRSLGSAITLQGNLDPAVLLSSEGEVRTRTRAMLEAFGPQRYIANLGHGILPETPVEHARAFIETVQSYYTKGSAVSAVEGTN